MPGSHPVAQTLDVPGARLHYERRGAGPLLLMIGSPMDSTGFAGLARALADRYTVVTYDPRGIGHSTREDATRDVTPDRGRRRPPPAVGARWGAGACLRQQRRGRRRARAGHRPPRPGADAGRRRASGDRVAARPRADARPDPGHLRHLPGRRGGQGDGRVHGPCLARLPARRPACGREPSPEQVATMRAATDMFLAHLLRPTTHYRPDLEALRAASTRIVVAAGATSKGQLAHRSGRDPRGPARYARGRVPRRPRRVHGPARAVRPGPGPGAHPWCWPGPAMMPGARCVLVVTLPLAPRSAVTEEE